jgi:hypothetical protein
VFKAKDTELGEPRPEKVALGVPNMQQVVNNLQVKNQKATSGQ